jgi:hypothetical protein
MNIQANDRIEMEILADGVISISTDSISEENHVQAQELVDSTLEAIGGERKTEHKPHFHKHGHVHTHSQNQVRA